jgi:hypothetical protein
MSTKTCFKCELEKPLDEFYQHGRMRDGHLNKCKTCTKLDVAANYWANHGKVQEYERGRRDSPHRVAARKEYAATERGRESHRRANHKYNRTVACMESKRRYREANPVKRRAHLIVSGAIRSGKLVRSPCEVCGNEAAQAHHDDYGKPLEVRWLCTTHHAEWHRHNTPLCPDQTEAA